MSTRAAFQASARFGLGPRGEELREIGTDPKGWLEGQLKSPQIPAALHERHGGAERVGEAVRAIRKRKSGDAEKAVKSLKDVYIEQTGARFAAQAQSSQPFVERTLLFWSNHFTVSVQKPIVAGLANAYEVEAIRPHLAGRFEDMLLAVMQHPAMLFYLDNLQSFGPGSRVGRRRGKGLNENLAREILELHTLGVDGGYSQEDVIALAKILTGWTLDRKGREIKIRYRFQPVVHEPGAKTLLGRRFAEVGEEEGIEALRMLARHPATARHIATKLARHYIADDPPELAIERLRVSFLETGGHLPSVMQTLLELDAAWAPLAKLKNPYEFALSAVRLTDIEPSSKQVIAGLEALNFRAFNAPSPAGYADSAEAWASPDALMKRIEWAQRLAQRLPARSDPLALAGRGIGPVMSQSTEQTIARAASAKDGVALLLASPEFQRR
jgi:uncharacterized protein (DUF1800 family)